MLHLTELSVPPRNVTDATMEVDPLVASDLDYSIKTWMAGRPFLACRPWRCISSQPVIRIMGWRSTPPERPEQAEASVFVSVRDFGLKNGQSIALTGQFIPIRRQGKAPTREKGRAFDAADGRADRNAAYITWLKERLIDVMPAAEVQDIRLDRTRHSIILRKGGFRNGVATIQRVRIPVAEATVWIKVIDVAGVEAWLLKGLGSQKAFGYGAFVPTLG